MKRSGGMTVAVCLAILAVLAQGCVSRSPKLQTLPRVLIIGDSISIGYMKPLTERLQGKAELVHNPGNARYSGYGLANLDAWLGDGRWDVIHFNFGLHDLKYVDDKGLNSSSAETGHIQVPLEKYRENMAAIAKKLKATKAVVIFASTTPYPNDLTSPLRKRDDVARYNQAALEALKPYGVRVDDLCGFAEPRLAELQLPQNVHFTEAGYQALAEQAAKSIEAALRKR